MASAPRSTSEATTFESAMERLDKIVAQIESAQMPLDELLERYEEGTQLIAICQEKLKAAEQRIEMVNRKAAPTSATPPSILETDPDVSLF